MTDLNLSLQFALAGLVFLVAIVVTGVVRKLARRWDVLDHPSEERKVHKKATPLLGGVAVIIAFAVGVLVAWPWLFDGYLLEKHMVGVLIGAAIVGIGGALDDRFNLPPRMQIVSPLIASIVIVLSGIGISYVTNPLGGTLVLDSVQLELFRIGGLPYSFTVLADLFTVVWMLGMMYTTKFLDGLDGLVSGVTVFGAFILFLLSVSDEVFQPETALLSILVVAAFLGFLLWNWNPAKIFLGESGSLFAGYILGVLAIISGAKVATTLLVLGVPILDVLWVIFRRVVIEKRSPFSGDRKHLHQRLVDSGMTQRQAVLLLYALTLAFGASGLFLQSRGKLLALVVLIVTMTLLGGIVVWQYKKGKARFTV